MPGQIARRKGGPTRHEPWRFQKKMGPPLTVATMHAHRSGGRACGLAVVAGEEQPLPLSQTRLGGSD